MILLIVLRGPTAWGQTGLPLEPAPGLVLPLHFDPIKQSLDRNISVARQEPNTLWFAHPDGIYRWTATDAKLLKVSSIERVDQLHFADGRLFLLRPHEPSEETPSDAESDQTQLLTMDLVDGSTQEFATLVQRPFITENAHYILFTTDLDTAIWDKHQHEGLKTDATLITLAGAGPQRTTVHTKHLPEAGISREIGRPTRICRDVSNPLGCRELKGIDYVQSNGRDIWFIQRAEGAQYEVHKLDLTSWNTSLVATGPIPIAPARDPSSTEREPELFDQWDLCGSALHLQFAHDIHRIDLDTGDLTIQPRLIKGSAFTSMKALPAEAGVQITVGTNRRSGDPRRALLYQWTKEDRAPTVLLELHDNEKVDVMEPHHQRLWASSPHRIYYQDRRDQPFKQLQWSPPDSGKIKAIWPLGDRLIIQAIVDKKSTYFFWSPSLRLNLQVTPDHGALGTELDSGIEATVQPLTGSRLPVVSGYHRLAVTYESSVAAPAAYAPPSAESAQFLVALAEDRPVKQIHLIPIEDFRYRFDLQKAVPFRQTTLHINGRDRFGNAFQHRIDATVVAGPLVGSVLLYFFWGAVSLAVILAAPWWRFANTLVMSPPIRKWGSLLAMPFFLTLVPSLRRHLLRRYRKNLDVSLRDSVQGYAPPEGTWEARAFTKHLTARRCIFITGASGLGKSAFLAYLASHAARHPWRTGRIDLPILIRLREHAQDAPEAVFASELKALGQFNDDDLRDELLRHGRILFLIDGLNEVPEGTRQRWSAFRRDHAFNHLFVFSSQAHEFEFQDLPATILAPLTDATVCELLIREGKVTREQVLGLPPQVLEFARNPQNLKTLASLLAAKKPIPQSQFGLYFEILNPLHDVWEANGQSHYGEQLAQAALKHLQEAQVDLTTALAPGALGALRTERLVVLRAGRLEFAHDRLAAFLAASYLDRKPDVVTQLTISKATNWQFVIDLLVEHTSVGTAQSLAFGLLDNSSPGALKLAEQLVFALHTARGQKLAPWLDEFDRLLTVKRRERRQPKAA
ncbi:NACHT domain-containing protein [Corallococcus terminator]